MATFKVHNSKLADPRLPSFRKPPPTLQALCLEPKEYLSHVEKLACSAPGLIPYVGLPYSPDIIPSREITFSKAKDRFGPWLRQSKSNFVNAVFPNPEFSSLIITIFFSKMK